MKSEAIPNAVLFLTAWMATAALAAEKVKVTADIANLRSAPGLESSILASVPKGTVFDVAGKSGDWYEVTVPSLNGAHAYIHKLLIELIPGEAHAGEGPPPPTATATPPPAAKPPSVTSTSTTRPRQTTPAGSKPSAQWQPQGVGLGVHVGGFHFGVRASVVGWMSERVGLEGLVSRYSIGSSDSALGTDVSFKYSVMQFSGGVRYRLGDPESTIHPYVGGGLSLFRSTSSFRISDSGVTEQASESSSNVGGFGVGGIEFTFKNQPHLAVTADL